jgi:hypothetical protein
MYNKTNPLKYLAYGIGAVAIIVAIILGLISIITSFHNNPTPSIVRLLHQGTVTDYRFDGNLRYSVTFSDGYMFFTKENYMAVVDCNLTELTELDMKQTYYLWEFKRDGSTDYVLTLCNDYVNKVRIKYPQNIYYIEQESK